MKNRFDVARGIANLNLFPPVRDKFLSKIHAGLSLGQRKAERERKTGEVSERCDTLLILIKIFFVNYSLLFRNGDRYKMMPRAGSLFT